MTGQKPATVNHLVLAATHTHTPRQLWCPHRQGTPALYEPQSPPSSSLPRQPALLSSSWHSFGIIQPPRSLHFTAFPECPHPPTVYSRRSDIFWQESIQKEQHTSASLAGGCSSACAAPRVIRLLLNFTALSVYYASSRQWLQDW